MECEFLTIISELAECQQREECLMLEECNLVQEDYLELEEEWQELQGRLECTSHP